MKTSNPLNVADATLGNFIAIPPNADLNNYLSIGYYCIGANATAATISDMPVKLAGTLEVSYANGVSSGSYVYIRQTYRPYRSNEMKYERLVEITPNGTTYNDWVRELIEGDLVMSQNKYINMGNATAGATGSAKFTIPSGYYVISSVAYLKSGSGCVIKTDVWNESLMEYGVYLKAYENLINAQYVVVLVLMKTNSLPIVYL